MFLRVNRNFAINFLNTFFICLLSPVTGKFTHVPEDVQACQGDTILLDWQFNNIVSSTTIVHCHKDGENVITITSALGTVIYPEYEGRLKYGDSGNITIENVTKEDSGLYTFEIGEFDAFSMMTYTANSARVDIYDHIRKPPVIEYDDKSNILKCRLNGMATATNDISLILQFNDSDTWQEKSIKPTTSGQYTCYMSGPIVEKCLLPGVDSSSSIVLSIGKPSVRARFSTVRAVTGQSTTLQCYAESAMPSVQSWKWSRVGTNSPVLSDSSTFYIPYVSKEQSGQYQCFAQNVIGESDPAFVTLAVIGDSATGNVTESTSNLQDNEFPILAVVLSACAILVVGIIAIVSIFFIHARRKRSGDNSRGRNDMFVNWLSQAQHNSGYDSASVVSGNSTETSNTSVHYQQIRDSIIATESTAGYDSVHSLHSNSTCNTGNESVQSHHDNSSSGTSSGYAVWNPHE